MAETFADHFSATSAGYARHRPDYPEALIDYLASLVPERRLAWDAGCGSGQLSVSLARTFEHVVGTDASAAQIARARPHARVAYAVRPAGSCGLEPNSVDLAVAAQAAHWFDLGAYYDEVRRVARPHAACVLASYGIMRIDAVTDPIVDRFYGSVLAPYWPPQRRHVETGYASLAFPFEEVAPPQLAIERIWRCSELLGYVATWSAVHGLEADGRGKEFDAFAHELAAAWGEPEETRGVRWPLGLRVGRVFS